MRNLHAIHSHPARRSWRAMAALCATLCASLCAAPALQAQTATPATAPSAATIETAATTGAAATAATAPTASAAPAQDARAIPASVQAALAKAQIPAQALSLVVQEIAPPSAAPPPARLAWQATEAMNPASVMKLVTTFAALELLGPAFVWETPVFWDGVVRQDRLIGTVYIQGQGDPQLVVERLWLLLRQLQAQGVRAIEGDIVLDRSAFDTGAHDPGAFDGEPQRAYNAAPDALLINYQALVVDFIPDPAAGVARVHYEPPLAGVERPASVPLAPGQTPCGDWKAALQADWAQAGRIRFAGSYSARCGQRQWSVALPEPERFAARAIEGLWRDMGGQLTGRVRLGQVPAQSAPRFVHQSPPLAQVLRDINKYSNNVMTQQLLLTLGRQNLGRQNLGLHKTQAARSRTGQTGEGRGEGRGGNFEAGRAVVYRWWSDRFPDLIPPVLDNGAGLSREARISADALVQMLQAAWASPVMPEFASSLPIAGVDGTLKRHQSRAVGRAHLKTGSLRDALALAGYVQAEDGRRYAVAVLINHPNASAARPALETLMDWVVLQK